MSGYGTDNEAARRNWAIYDAGVQRARERNHRAQEETIRFMREQESRERKSCTSAADDEQSLRILAATGDANAIRALKDLLRSRGAL